WHFLSAVCGLPGQLSPLVDHDATVRVAGSCANVREGPSLKARVVACLKDGSTVHVDAGPTYADGRLWWHEPHGWSAHAFVTDQLPKHLPRVAIGAGEEADPSQGLSRISLDSHRFLRRLTARHYDTAPRGPGGSGPGQAPRCAAWNWLRRRQMPLTYVRLLG